MRLKMWIKIKHVIVLFKLSFSLQSNKAEITKDFVNQSTVGYFQNEKVSVDNGIFSIYHQRLHASHWNPIKYFFT